MRSADYGTIGRFDDAAMDVGEAILLEPRVRPAIDTSNRFAATHPFRILPEYEGLDANHRKTVHRDPELTVKLALTVAFIDKGFQYVDTLAAAYADAGNFPAAVAHQELAIKRIPDSERDEKLLEAMEYRLNLYRQGRAYRDCGLVDYAFRRAPPEKLEAFRKSGQPIECTPPQ